MLGRWPSNNSRHDLSTPDKVLRKSTTGVRIPPKLKLRGHYDEDVIPHFRCDKSSLNTSVLSEGPVMKDHSSQGSMHVPVDDNPSCDLSAKIKAIEHLPLFNKHASETPSQAILNNNRRDNRKFLVQTLTSTEQRNECSATKKMPLKIPCKLHRGPSLSPVKPLEVREDFAMPFASDPSTPKLNTLDDPP